MSQKDTTRKKSSTVSVTEPREYRPREDRSALGERWDE